MKITQVRVYADAPSHLGEVGLAWGPVPVAAGPPQVGFAPEPLDQVPHVRDLQQLAEHQGPQVPLRAVLDRPPGSITVQPYPEDGMDRS